MAIDLARQLVARGPLPDPASLALLREAGVDPVIASAAELSAAGATASHGVWPGIRRPGRRINWDNDLFASASAEPWIDSNSYLVPFERATTGQAQPLLAYEAGPATGLAADRSVPFSTLELALAEARLQGGNYVLSFDPRFRAALAAGDKTAREALTSLGRTAAWLASQADLCGLAAPPTITALVEPGEATAELANLLYRRNASPRLVSAASVPPPDPENILVLVAASLKAVPAAVWKHAEAGSTVVIDDPKLVQPGWKSVRREQDREIFSLGRGQVVVYPEAIVEPSEFALDVVDLVGHRRRPARLWNARSAVAWATAAPRPGDALLHIVNYGSPQEEDVQARIHGRFASAVLLRPESPAPIPLKTAPRGLATEVFLPDLRHLAIVRFSRG